MTSKNDPRRARSREKVLSAAADLLVTCGPRALTVDGISERSGVAKSTIYRHWDSRAEIVVDVLRNTMPTLEACQTDDFEQALRSVLSNFAQAMSCPHWSRMLPAFASLRVSMPDVAELHAADLDQRLAVIRQLRTQGVNEGRLDDTLDDETLLHLLLGPMVMATLAGRIESLADLANRIGRDFLAAHPRQGSNLRRTV